MQQHVFRFILLLGVLMVALGLFGSEGVGADGMPGVRPGLVWSVSPVIGYDRNELKVGGPGGTTTTQRDTAPEYGLYLQMTHPNLVINNFLFYSDINEADVFGDLAFANYYADPTAPVTANVGAGYLYHKIKPENEDIRVSVPMLKAGPLFRVEPWHVSVNPYLGYAWERVNTRHGDQPNDSWLYGLSARWHWRLFEAAANYYYQDSLGIDENLQTFHGRCSAFVSEAWGMTVRVDYMEHQRTQDTSVLVGPIFFF